MAAPASQRTILFLSPLRACATSATTPGVTYELARVAGAWTCNCPGFRFRGTCRHTVDAAASQPPFRCMTCAQAPAAAGKTECWTCSNHTRDERAELSLANWGDDGQAAGDAFTPTAHCRSCQQVYPFSDESYQSRLDCPACRHEPVRVGLLRGTSGPGAEVGKEALL